MSFRMPFHLRSRGGVSLVALALALGAGLAIGACGGAGSPPRTATNAHPLGHSASAALPIATVKIALDWTANVNYLGIYAAIARGYFTAEHIKPVILPYANASAEQLIQAHQTDLGISYPPDVIINNSTGKLHYKALAALVTDNTTALGVLASSPYHRPAQLNGRIYGGFGIASDRPLVTSVLRGDGVKHPVYKQVVLGTDVITALKAHRVDYTAVFDGIDDVTAAIEGVKLRTFLYSRYLGAAGDYPNAVFVAGDSDLRARRAVLARALRALARGYEFAAAHPAAAERILIADNATALGSANGRRITVATGNATAPHFLDHGQVWGPEKDSYYLGLERILAAGHLISSSPPPSELYTNSLLPAP
jgi:ABC-type nitrate/sulfonate/bicarbonate transport system substrate-binding protein